MDPRGRCGRCEFATLCGGCRGRAFGRSGDYLGEDPWCSHEPAAHADDLERTRTSPTPPLWTQEAEVRLLGVPPFLAWTPRAAARLERVPDFARGMARKAIEDYARRQGLTVVDEQVVQEARQRLGM